MSQIDQLERTGRLLRDFDRQSRLLVEVLASFYGRALASVYLDETRREFRALIPHIPRIGGARSRYSRDAIGMSYGLALYKVLHAHGRSTDEIGRVVHVLARASLASLPCPVKWASRLLKALLSTRLGKRLFKMRLKHQAARSQQQADPAGVVAVYVEGDGRTFDCGMDITHCPMWDFYRAQGAGEFLRYVCLYDMLASALSGTGLVRTMTLSEGADRCDNRFRLGKAPENRQRTQLLA
ncbi:MAG: L-2-amino-thiazoline-4-carboxylic acid hydrolase [Anaerolineae bacterium]|nr:L-2-amino-thiazoline-4-carboxylic acid hydrolase [Anaerolineae bacterium]